jgi:hypothetical protein
MVPRNREGINELTGEKNEYFSISELEVWEMIWY